MNQAIQQFDTAPKPKQGVWTASPRDLMGRNWRPILSVIAFVLVAFAVRLAIQGQIDMAVRTGYWVSVVYGSLFFVALWLTNKGSADEEVVDLLEGSDGDSAVVQMTVSLLNSTLGADQGIFWCGEGLAHFYGKRCSFALARNDFSASLETDLLLKITGSTQSVTFSPLRHREDQALKDTNEVFREAFNLGPASSEALAERIYPPTEHWREADRRLRNSPKALRMRKA